MLRIDVDTRDRSRQYAIPATTRIAAAAASRRSGRSACATRGASRSTATRATCGSATSARARSEEIDFAGARHGRPLNFGWDAFEGRSRFDPKPTPGRLIRPVSQYSHAEARAPSRAASSYRGARAPSLRGRYVYADYCKNWIRSIRKTASGASGPATHDGVDGITSFGEGGNGDVYVASASTGRVYRLVG